MSWMFFSLMGATLVGLVGIVFFKRPQGPRTNFYRNGPEIFPLILIGLILCAVLAATINAMSSQVLVFLLA